MAVRARALANAVGLAALLGACSYLDPGEGKPVVGCVETDSNPDAPVDFGLQIRPLMNRPNSDPTGRGCSGCHYRNLPVHSCYDSTGLDLSTLGALREGGVTTGTNIVIPGKPCESGLLQKLLGDYPVGIQMPKGGAPWTASQIQLVHDWIAEGASGSPDE